MEVILLAIVSVLAIAQFKLLDRQVSQVFCLNDERITLSRKRHLTPSATLRPAMITCTADI